MKSSYFIYKSQRYKDVEGAPMDPPLSLLLANLYLEQLERRITYASEKL